MIPRKRELALVLLVLGTRMSPAAEGMRILTFVPGVANGRLPVVVDLGSSPPPAELLHNGRPALRFSWSHENAIAPRDLIVTIDGAKVYQSEPHDVAMPYAKGRGARVVAVELVFQDGERATRTLLIGGGVSSAVESPYEVTIPAANLALLPAAGGRTAKIAAFVALLDGGDVTAAAPVRREFRTGENAFADAEGRFVFTGEAVVAPGSTISIGILDESSQETGFERIEVGGERRP